MEIDAKFVWIVDNHIIFREKINKINLKRKCKIGKARNVRMCYNIVDIDNRPNGRKNISDRSKSMGD